MASFNLNAKYKVLENGKEYITSDYGYRTLEGKMQWHKGIDYANPAQWIIAPCDLTIMSTLNSIEGVDKVKYTAGNYVKAKTNLGLVIRFLHMKKGTVQVKKGQKVKAGTRLGYMGTTGYSLGVHLHLDINSNGEYVDPKPYLRGEKPLFKETIPITPVVTRDESKNQVQVLVNCLNVRTGAGTSYERLGYATKGGIYNYYETKSNNGYTWYRIADNQWLAQNTKNTYLKIYSNEEHNKMVSELKKEIDTLKAKNKELENTIIEKDKTILEQKSKISELESRNWFSMFVEWIRTIFKKN